MSEEVVRLECVRLALALGAADAFAALDYAKELEKFILGKNAKIEPE